MKIGNIHVFIRTSTGIFLKTINTVEKIISNSIVQTIKLLIGF